MFKMWYVALTVLTLALVSAQDIGSSCPDVSLPNCPCTVLTNDGLEYACSGYVVTVFENKKEATINCNTQTLDCSKLPDIPLGGNQVLEQLRLEDCSLSTSLECALAKLNGTGTRQLMIHRLRSALGEETFRGLGALLYLFIFESVVDTPFPVAALNHIPNISTIRLGGVKLLDLPSHAFANSSLNGLRKLEISMNKLPHVPADVFVGLSQLTVLSLFMNKIRTIDRNAFRGLDSLVELNMYSNDISSVPSGLFQHTPQLVYLYMGRNQQMRLEEGVLSGLERLQTLELQETELVLGSRAFSNLPSLKDVDLSEAAITELPGDLFQNSTGIVNLTLSYNQISYLPETVFEGLHLLKKLILTANSIKNVTRRTFEPLANLTKIYLDKNQITMLPQSLFSSVYELQTVSFARNRISEVHRLTFRNSRSITRLDLSHNKLDWNCTAVPDDEFYSTRLIDQSPITNLDKLIYLDLSHNYIKTFCNDWAAVMINIKELNLSFNNITELTAFDMSIADRAVFDLRNNSITRITPNEYLHHQPTLLLANNPYICDCFMYQYLSKLSKLPYQQNAKCDLPSSLKNLDLSYVANHLLDKVVCTLPDTPEGCNCVSRPALNRTECICEKIMYKYLPKPSNSGYSDMLLQLKSKQDLKGLPSFVKTLNLTNLKLDTVPYIPKSVRHIDLSYNKLRKIPIEVLTRYNLTLELRNNSFNCDCEGAEEIADIKNAQKEFDEKITDFDNLFCTDGFSLEGVDPPRLCYLFYATAIGSSLAILGIIFLIIGIIFYKYSLEIKIYLYHHGWDWLIKEEMLDKDKIYDIFLSYSHKDEEFVLNNLFPILDREYKVCIHSRDWLGGEVIVEQIYRTVAESRRTLIVFSKDFLQSTWALEEFRAAYNQTVLDKRLRILVVLIDDVKYDTAPELIKNYLNLTTYIEWKDQFFWKKLRSALPRRIEAEDVRKKQTTATAVKNLAGGLNVICNEDGKLVNFGDLDKQLGVILAPKGMKEV